MLRKSFYRELGGHRGDAADPEAALLRRIGRAADHTAAHAGHFTGYLTTSTN